MPWRLRPTARKRGRRTHYGDTWRLQALRQLRPRSAGAQLGAMPRVPQAQQMGAQTGAEVVAVAWSGSGPGGCPAGARPPQRGGTRPGCSAAPYGGRNIKRYARPWAPPAPSRPLRAPGPAAGPCPGAALPARRSGPRRLAGGGGPGCGALGPPPGPRGPSGGRLACRRPASPVAPASCAPPGCPRCGVGGSGPWAGLPRPRPRPRSWGSWVPVSGALVRLAGGGPVPLRPCPAPLRARRVPLAAGPQSGPRAGPWPAVGR